MIDLPTNNILDELKSSDIGNEILDSTIGTKKELWEQKKQIEEDKTIGEFEKMIQTLKINFQGKLLFGLDREDEFQEESKEDDETNQQENPNETNTNTEYEVEAFDPVQGLLFIDLVKENKQKFAEKVIQIAQKLHINPNRLMRVMKKESGLDHTAQNESGATGLIQFMPKTARSLGTTTRELKNMSNLQQLDYVEKYYQSFHSNIDSYETLYFLTFYPAAIGKPDNYIIGSEVSKARAKKVGQQNNMNKGNPITKAHVKNRISKDIPDTHIAQFQGTTNTAQYA